MILDTLLETEFLLIKVSMFSIQYESLTIPIIVNIVACIGVIRVLRTFERPECCRVAVVCALAWGRKASYRVERWSSPVFEAGVCLASTCPAFFAQSVDARYSLHGDLPGPFWVRDI